MFYLKFNNFNKLAKLISYPIKVNFDSGTEYFNSEKEFITHYSKIVTAEMMARVKRQKFSELFVNSYGMHIGYGDIWFAGRCVGKTNHPSRAFSLLETASLYMLTKQLKGS